MEKTRKIRPTFFIKYLLIFLILMPVVTWDMLAKNQTDPETVEECVARLIDEHNDDETAHVSAGQSLSEHKTDPVIDHPALSVVQDKLADGVVDVAKFSTDYKILVLDFLQTTDFTVVKSSGCNFYGQFGFLALVNDSVSGHYIDCLFYTLGLDLNFDLSKDFIFQFYAYWNNAANHLSYLMFGSSGMEEGQGGLGFKVNNGTLYAIYIDGSATEETVQINGINLALEHVYKVLYSAADATAYFYIDDTLYATIDEIDTEIFTDMFFDYYIKNNSASSRVLYVSDIRIGIAR